MNLSKNIVKSENNARAERKGRTIFSQKKKLNKVRTTLSLEPHLDIFNVR